MAELGATVELSVEDEAQVTEEEDNVEPDKLEIPPVKADLTEEDAPEEQAAPSESQIVKADEAPLSERADPVEAADPVKGEVESGKATEDDDDELLAAKAGAEDDEEMAEPETETRTLFGDDEGDEIMADEPQEETIMETRPSRPRRRETDMNEEFDGKPEYVTLPIDLPPAAPSEADDLWILGLPMTMSVDHEVFDHADASAHEKRIIQERNGPAMKAMRAALTPGCIRAMKKDDGELVSNTRLVEFSDGTCALFVGKSVCEAQARGEEGQLFLVEMSQDPIYHIHGTLSQRRVFKPPNVASADTRNVRVTCQSQKKTKMTTVQAGAESELKVKRHLEEQAMKDMESVERKPKKKRYSALDANFLEADE